MRTGRTSPRTWTILLASAGSIVVVALAPAIVSLAAACAAAAGWCALLERQADLELDR